MNFKILIPTITFQKSNIEELTKRQIVEVLDCNNLKHAVIEIDENFPKSSLLLSKSILFNLVPLFGHKYSKFVPAVCELMNIPYSGSGIFTISAFDQNYLKLLLEYHNLQLSPINYKSQYIVSVLGNLKDSNINFIKINDTGLITTSDQFSEKLFRKISNIAFKIQRALRIYDYFTFVLSPGLNPNNLLLCSITPSPNLEINSLFCRSFYSLGLTYQEIIFTILIQTLNRYNIQLPNELLAVEENLLQIRQNIF